MTLIYKPPKFMTGQHIIEVAKFHLGESYRLGALVPKNDSTWKGPWDCAEYATFCVYQSSGKLYGCVKNEGNPATADAYTGFWMRDGNVIGNKIPVELAAKTPGAFLLRIAGSGMIGHIVICEGTGRTFEAHSRKDGVLQKMISGRRWDCGILPPWIQYTHSNLPVSIKPAPLLIYRWTTPLMASPAVAKIQEAVGIKPDGIFGSKTFHAVRTFQDLHGLVPDGEVGPLTMTALGL